MLSTARKFSFFLTVSLWTRLTESASSYENLAAQVHRMESLDSFSFAAEKNLRANEFRRAHDYV